MNSNLTLNFSVDKENNKIKVERTFAASLANVWAAWTQPELLDQWWAPRPWQTKTKSMDLKVGGTWLYAMVGPEGEAHWCRADYKSIAPLNNYSALDAFCDENGNITDPSFPRSLWNNTFKEIAAASTTVFIEIKYDTLADLEKIIELGFKEGFTMAMGNLDELFSK